jgi:hypothetical protein
MKRKMKWSVGILSCICIVLLVSPACTAGLSSLNPKKKNTQTKESTQSQYWALLFAVGVYENAPDQDRPEMLQACDDLYNVLIGSPQFWQASNIHTVKGSQAILQNLIRELLWLRKNSKSEDYVLVYLTTHGSQLRDKYGQPLDLPPKDEADGSDEFLVMYNGFTTWYGIIWDDMLNFFLSMIKCKGLCLIVDSCYSGGFNDQPFTDINPRVFTAESFNEGFAKDVSAANRIVLMSTQEDTVSFGTFFSSFLIEGFSGWADFEGNNDGINSAEEAFSYAVPRTEFWVWFNTGYEQHPTINDMYPGEFPITT